MTFPSGCRSSHQRASLRGQIRLAARVAGFDRNEWLGRHGPHDVALAPPQHRAEHIAGEVHRVCQRRAKFYFLMGSSSGSSGGR